MGFKFNEDAKALGFQDHDILVGYDGKTFERFDVDVYRYMAEAKTVQVKRNGKDLTIKMPEDMSLLNMLKAEPAFCRPFIPAELDTVMPGSPAAKAGMLKGDKIVSINGKPVDSWNEFTYQIGILSDMLANAKTAKDSLKIRTATVVTNRDSVNLVLTEDLKLGVGQTSIATYYKPKEVSYGFFESFPAGIKFGLNVLRGYVPSRWEVSGPSALFSRPSGTGISFG